MTREELRVSQGLKLVFLKEQYRNVREHLLNCEKEIVYLNSILREQEAPVYQRQLGELLLKQQLLQGDLSGLEDQILR